MIKRLLILTIATTMLIGCKKDEEATPNNSSTTTTGTGSNNNSTGSSKSVQERLNAGQTPISIYNSDSTLLDSLYGKKYAGGLIFYLKMADSSGMVAASVNQSTSAQWGCNTSQIENVDCPFGANSCVAVPLSMKQTIGGGTLNSAEIVWKCNSSSAAKTCINLELNNHDDWFLPSTDEAKLMLDKLNLVGTYWTSTQSSRERAWAASRSEDANAFTYQLYKTGWKNVRAVRSF